MRFQSRVIIERLEARVDGWQFSVAGRYPGQLTLRVARRFAEVRVTGLAAEMSHYLVLSLLPLVTALGASIGLLGRVLDREQIEGMEDALVYALEAVLSPELARDVAVPMVQELLRQERAGVAIGGVAVALWLGGRVFRAAVRVLDDAYRVEERRGLLQLWGLSLVLTAAAVVVVTLLLSVVVVGPLLGGGRRLAGVFGAGDAFAWAWSFGRWPVVLLVGVAFLAWLYHVGPNTDTSWRDTLPGALLATAALILLAAGFRLYVDLAGPRGPNLQDGSEAVLAVGQFIGTALAAILFTWLASVAVLLGGVLNAEWQQPGRVVDQWDDVPHQAGQRTHPAPTNFTADDGNAPAATSRPAGLTLTTTDLAAVGLAAAGAAAAVLTMGVTAARRRRNGARR